MSPDVFRRPSSESALSATYAVNKFASSPLDFLGSGSLRTQADVYREAADRLADLRTLARLAVMGVDGRRGAALTAVDLATCGLIVGDTLPELRRIPLFRAVIHAEKTAARADMDAWLASRPVGERVGKRIIHMRLRPYDGIAPVHRLRAEHQRLNTMLGRHLSYAQRLDESFVVLAHGTHHRPMHPAGYRVDVHFHGAFEVSDDTDMDRIVSYLATHYDVWLDEDDAADPAGLAAYLRDGSARYAGDFGDEQLAEYVSQVHRLHRYESHGPLRRFLRRRNAARVLSYRPRRVRAEPGTVEAGPTIAAVRCAWLGDELRPVVMVRGWRGSWADLTSRYDLSEAVEAARLALSGTPLSSPAVTPNISPAPFPRVGDPTETEASGGPRSRPPDPGEPFIYGDLDDIFGSEDPVETAEG